MKAKISRVVKHSGRPVAFTVKVKGIKYPRGLREFYFPRDKKPETALEMAIMDYTQEKL